MPDLIDRRAALTAICAECPRIGHCDGCVASRALLRMPAALIEPTEIRAHWIQTGAGYLSCEHCKIMTKIRSEYCSKCGAKMYKEVLTKWPDPKVNDR